MNQKSTGELTAILNHTEPEAVGAFYTRYAEEMVAEEKAFSRYIREKIRKNGLLQQNVFLNADIPERYGYKLISEEKRTKQRDLILRILLASRLTLQEAQKALTLYGFSVLYPRKKRDMVLMIAFNKEIFDCAEVDELLTANGQPPLYRCTENE